MTDFPHVNDIMTRQNREFLLKTETEKDTIAIREITRTLKYGGWKNAYMDQKRVQRRGSLEKKF